MKDHYIHKGSDVLRALAVRGTELPVVSVDPGTIPEGAMLGLLSGLCMGLRRATTGEDGKITAPMFFVSKTETLYEDVRRSSSLRMPIGDKVDSIVRATIEPEFSSSNMVSQTYNRPKLLRLLYSVFKESVWHFIETDIPGYEKIHGWGFNEARTLGVYEDGNTEIINSLIDKLLAMGAGDHDNEVVSICYEY